MPMEGLFPDMVKKKKKRSFCQCIISTKVRRGFLEYYDGSFLHAWKSKWFVLSDNCLYMFDAPESEGLIFDFGCLVVVLLC